MYRPIFIAFILIILASTKVLSQTDSARQEQHRQEQQYSKELNDNYSQIVSYLNKSKNKKAQSYCKLLSESQKHWDKYILNYCTLNAEPAKETPRGSDYFYRDCKIEKTIQRLNELNQQYADIKAELE